MSYRVLRGRVESFCRHYRGQKFHALLGDPPYHLTSITKRFGNGNAAPAQYGKDGAFARASRGFMGQQWDGGATAFDPETWAALGEHLYPGAFGMAFAAARGSHRLACAIEDAGFIIHPQIGWCYGSGFPKATRIKNTVDTEWLEAFVDVEGELFGGHRYGLQAMKPALEPIIVFQKPYEGRPVDCITATGAGALNVDGGRVEAIGGITSGGAPNGHNNPCFMSKDNDPRTARTEPHPGGRWPSNLILECTCNPRRPDRDQHGDGCPVRMIGEQSGESASPPVGAMGGGSNSKAIYGDYAGHRHANGYGDDGTAARFFQQCDWSLDVLEQLQQAEPLQYEAKASRAERDAGLGSLPLHFLATMGDGIGVREHNENEPSAWVRNPHPTVKPISLAKYLATLLLPPAAYAPRRILVPFAGVGSEMIGTVLAGWDEVIGVEMTREYIPVANARLAWWSDWLRWGQSDVDKILAAVGNDMLPMFQREAA